MICSAETCDILSSHSRLGLHVNPPLVTFSVSLRFTFCLSLSLSLSLLCLFPHSSFGRGSSFRVFSYYLLRTVFSNFAFPSVLLPLSQQRSAIPKPNAMAHCPDGISGPNISTTTATFAAPPTSQQPSLIPSPPPAPPASSSPTHNPPPSTTTAVQHAASVMDVDCKSPENRSQRAASVLSMDDLEAAQALEGLRSGLYTHSCLLYI